MASTQVGLVSVTDNGDGTATVRKRMASGDIAEQTIAMADGVDVETGPAPRPKSPKSLEVEVLGRSVGKGLQDCTWCRYGKPALAGAVGGVAVASVAGMEPARGLVWGGIGGLLYGHLRG